MSIKTVGVVGAGVMGTGIAQVCASAGLKVIIRDIADKYVDAAVGRISASLGKAVEKGKISEQEKNDTLARIRKTTELKDLAEADLIIEAVLENLELKKDVFAQLNDICPENTIFATNTSSMSVTDIASASGRADRFCGIHFFNPVPVMKLVEIVSGLKTSDSTIEAAYELVEILGKIAVHVKKDSPGFIVNKLLLPYFNEAVKLVEEGVATPEDIDTAARYGLNYPMGPFQMLDMGGIDLSITILDYFAQEFNDPHYAPKLLLRQMVRAGKLGQKSGEGFYNYKK